MVLLIMLYKVVLTFLDKTLVFDHSNKSYRAVLSVHYAVQGGSNF